MSMSETGLRLCAPNAAAAIAAVRALSEGRSQRRLVRVPFTEFRAPTARAACAWEDLNPVRLVNTERSSRDRAKQQMAAFKASQPGKFTSADLALHAGIEIHVAGERLQHLAECGEVIRMGKAGRNIVWRFA